jgi:cyclohexanecarboxylate-CoA ligase
MARNRPQPTSQDDILRVGAQLFRQHGYTAATTREIAEHLKIRNASLYHHIASKEELLYRICRESIERIIHTVKSATLEGPIEERVPRLIHGHITEMLANHDMNATMLLELRALTGDFRVKIITLRDQYETFVRTTVAGAQDQGLLRTDITDRHLTLMLMSLLNWPMVWFRPDGELTAAELGDLIMRLFLEGARAPSESSPERSLGVIEATDSNPVEEPHPLSERGLAETEELRAGALHETRGVPSADAQGESGGPGRWETALLHDLLDRQAADRPGAEAVVSRTRGSGFECRLTFGDLAREVERLAQGFIACGVKPGDSVVVQLPNWYEMATITLALSRTGAIVCPVTHIYRQHELRFILSLTEARCFVIPDIFRRFDYREMAAGLRDELPALTNVIVVGGEAPEHAMTYDELLNLGDAVVKAPYPQGDVNDVALVAFTSGTTGESKGVMHSHSTLLAAASGVVTHMRLQPPILNLVVSPVGHLTGFLWGWVLSLMLGGKSVFQDKWDPARAVRHIEDEGITLVAGATTFIQDLLNYPELDAHNLSSLDTFITAGAPIPPRVVTEASRRLGCAIYSAWGMSEYPIATAIGATDDQFLASASDGRVVPGAEIRIMNPEGKPCGVDEVGELQVRGAGLFVGYYGRPEAAADSTTDDGYLMTGDLARYCNLDGFIRIAGRTKDIIIRGGENIPCVEIESLIYEHEAVRDVALVGVPDERLGERVCAYVVLREGATELTLDDLHAHLIEKQVARQMIPEFIELVSDLPRTPSGKVQKFKLRELLSGSDGQLAGGGRGAA